MTVTANGVTVLACVIHVPRRGCWHADLSVQAEEDGAELQGAVDLALDDATWRGYARRVGSFVGRTEVLLVGGAGGLDVQIEPRYYADAQASLALNDLLREAGETLSSTVAPGATSVLLPRWTRPRGRAGAALGELVEQLGVEWRVLPDGTVWLGSETWEEVEIEHELLELDPAQARAVIAVDSPSLLPGTTFLGRRVSYVQHTIEPARTRSTVWFESE